jgi:hypothetical protein
MSNVSNSAGESSRWADIGQQSVPESINLSGTVTNANPVFRILGATNAETGMQSYDCAGDDPYPVPGRAGWIALHTPVWRFTEAAETGQVHSCPWLNGLDPYTDHKDPRAVVLDYMAQSWSAGTTWESVDVASAGITGCAHLAVSPNGNNLLCTNQPEVRTLIDPVDGARTQVNEIYGFERSGGSWVSARPGAALFDHQTPRGLPDSERIWAAGLSCHVYRTKQGSFCGSPDWIAADVYCEDTAINPADPRQVFARAMLINIAYPEQPRYIDLTSAVEDATGQERGALGAYTLACADDQG